MRWTNSKLSVMQRSGTALRFCLFFFFFFACCLFFFPQDRHHIVQRQYVIISFSSITGECGSSTAPLQKHVEFMSLTLYGSNNKEKAIFCCSLIFPPFYNGLIQTFSPPNRAAQKALGISGQSNVQSSMGQNSKERNTSGFHIMEVMINMEGYTSSLTMNSMF